MTKRFCLWACAGLLATTVMSTSYAADMPRPAYKAPAYVAPLYNWTGFYAGLNAGYGWSGSDSGFVGGGQIGYNWQAVGSPLVLGLEADLQGTSIKSTTNYGGGVTGEAKIPAFGTVRGRIGYAWDRALLYATGGWAYTSTKFTLSGPGGSVSDSKWGSGYTLGGGLEYGLSGNWSVKGEYLYVRVPGNTLTLLGTPVAFNSYNFSVVRAGVNYQIGRAHV